MIEEASKIEDQSVTHDSIPVENRYELLQ